MKNPGCRLFQSNERKLIGKIFLHSSFLHVSLPPRETLEDIRATRRRQGERNKRKSRDDGNNRQQQQQQQQQLGFIPYQEEENNGQRQITVAYQCEDIDFESRAAQTVFEGLDFLVVCVFDVSQ